eukprot:gene1334-11416_t
MSIDFVIFRHRELCQQEKMDEARDFSAKHQISIDWNHISSLIAQEQYVSCFLYTQGFFDHDLPSEQQKCASLFQVYSILKDFLFEENLDEIKRINMDLLKILASEFSKDQLKQQIKVSASTSKQVENKAKYIQLYNRNRTPMKKRYVTDFSTVTRSAAKKLPFSEIENFNDQSPLDSESVLFKEIKEKMLAKKRSRRKCSKTPRDRIIHHFEKFKKPATWSDLKEIIPGNKSEIWRVLNHMVSENVINQSGGGKRGNPYYFELCI